MNQERKLLFVDNSIDTFYSYRLSLARAAKRAGFQVHVAAPHGACEQKIADEGFSYHPIRLTRRGAKVFEEITSIAELFWLYRRLKPDIIHHLRLKPVLYGGLAAQLAKMPAEVSMPTGLGYVFTAHNSKASIMRRVTLLGCRLAFFGRNIRVICQNPDDRSVFIASNTITPDKCILIKGSGVDVLEFAPSPEPEGVPVVLLAARMLRDKGVAEFVEAARALKAQGVEARFVLVGDTDSGNPTAFSADQLRAWRDSGLVEWWGHRQDMEFVLAQANIICLPSYREGVPKVLIEAAAAGRAIVTTDVPGCREIVKHGQNGLLVPAQDAKSLASAIRLLLENPGIRSRMARRGRHLAVANFSMDRVIAETIDVYHQVLTKRAPGVASAQPMRTKRYLDIVVSLGALLFTAPLFFAIALAIKVSSPGGVMYRGVRIGKDGKPFRILKFRTMVANAESLGGSATAKDDPRVTKIGRLLRKYKLDELPQFINVLKGEMSLVGPRPEVKKYVDQYKGEELTILKLQPGITDWASIWNSAEGEVLAGSPDPERTYEELIRPTKIALQLKYARDHSFGVDLQILLHTAIKLLHPGWVPSELSQYQRVKHFHELKTTTMNEKAKPETSELPASVGGTAAVSQRFRFILPSLPPLEQIVGLYRPAYHNGLITNAECVTRFEDAAAEYLGAKHCVAVSSCTSGLMLVMRALGLTGEVIVPSFTFFATGHAVRWNGLRPVFAECDPQSWTIDPRDVEALITEKTSAILAVHMYGNPCPVDALSSIAARHGLKLIFDAAHAFGSKRNGRSVGQFGDAEVFSLSPTKVLVAGEGGLIATGDATLARALKVLRNYGDSGSYDPEWIGMNARMTEFNAALALGGLAEVESKVKRRNEIAEMYTAGLKGLPGVRFQSVRAEDVHTYKDYSIHVSSPEFGLSRDVLARELLAENIETKKYFYPPLHRQQLYTALQTRPLPNTDHVSENILSLPIYEALPDATIEQVVNAIHKIHTYYVKASSKGRDEEVYVTAVNG